MKHNLSKMVVDIPALETSVEGKLRGGFSYVTHGDVSICGGPNNHCRRGDRETNSVCSDNDVCYDNHDAQACSGNYSTNCSSHRSHPTSTSTSSSTSTSKLMSDIFSLF